MQKEHCGLAIKMFLVLLIFLLSRRLREPKNRKKIFGDEMKLCGCLSKIDFSLSFCPYCYLNKQIGREQKKYGTTPLKKAVDLQKLNQLVSIG